MMGGFLTFSVGVESRWLAAPAAEVSLELEDLQPRLLGTLAALAPDRSPLMLWYPQYGPPNQGSGWMFNMFGNWFNRLVCC